MLTLVTFTSSCDDNRRRWPVQSQRRGFTLVELLVGITVIAILVGLLTAGAVAALRRAREFAIQTEMSQIESAIQQFEIQYGFFPPSFKGINTANDLLPLLARIAPNNNESAIVTGTTRRIDTWWANVGMNIKATQGADLVFWLSGLSKNKQFPLTMPALDTSGSMPQAVPLAAHAAVPGDRNEREVFFDFNLGQLNVNGNVATYLQPGRIRVPYLYLDARNYLPTSPNDGAYCRGGFMPADYMTITDGSLLVGSPLFEQIYFNPDSFQLITFGLDGAPGVATSPNRLDAVMNFGADNIVNFGPNGPAKISTFVFDN